MLALVQAAQAAQMVQEPTKTEERILAWARAKRKLARAKEQLVLAWEQEGAWTLVLAQLGGWVQTEVEETLAWAQTHKELARVKEELARAKEEAARTLALAQPWEWVQPEVEAQAEV